MSPCQRGSAAGLAVIASRTARAAEKPKGAKQGFDPVWRRGGLESLTRGPPLAILRSAFAWAPGQGTRPRASISHRLVPLGKAYCRCSIGRAARFSHPRLHDSEPDALPFRSRFRSNHTASTPVRDVHIRGLARAPARPHAPVTVRASVSSAIESRHCSRIEQFLNNAPST